MKTLVERSVFLTREYTRRSHRRDTNVTIYPWLSRALQIPVNTTRPRASYVFSDRPTRRPVCSFAYSLTYKTIAFNGLTLLFPSFFGVAKKANYRRESRDRKTVNTGKGDIQIGGARVNLQPTVDRGRKIIFF